jgi:hypothetical protein
MNESELIQRLDQAQDVASAILDRVDWERLAEGRELGVAVALYLRRHPWVLIAAGVSCTALGIAALAHDGSKSGGTREER